jgi:hypothetical protein
MDATGSLQHRDRKEFPETRIESEERGGQSLVAQLPL